MKRASYLFIGEEGVVAPLKNPTQYPRHAKTKKIPPNNWRDPLPIINEQMK